MRSPRWRRNVRLKCGCGGYWFPHRKGGGACDHSRTCRLHRAIRNGDAEEIAEAHAELAITGYGLRVTTKRCPF